MGQGTSAYDQSELAEFQDLTYFTKREVLHVHKRFAELAPEKVKQHGRNPTLTKEEILLLPELAANPFKERILEVFSDAGDGNMNFEQFLDMMSQLSSKAPLETKIDFAFKIYDFNEDGQICENDLQKVILFLVQPAVTGATLTSDERNQVIKNQKSCRVSNKKEETVLTEKEISAIVRNSLITDDQIKKLAQKVINEMDMDDDGSISYLDFKHGMSKLNGFEESFKVTL
ncbi:hypothetical protein ACHWQZ_G008584 [Mnemiopsis leidyi]